MAPAPSSSTSSQQPSVEPTSISGGGAARVDVDVSRMRPAILAHGRERRARAQRPSPRRGGDAVGPARTSPPDLRRRAGGVLYGRAMPGRRAFSVAVFCRHGGEVLLVHHRRLGTWLPVGGEIEPGETPLEAARRELREETGLEGRFPEGLGVDGTPAGLIGYEEHPAGSKGLHMNFAFVADVASREIAACDEFDAHGWFGPAELAAVECPRNVRELA